jgi:hypothetical protein
MGKGLKAYGDIINHPCSLIMSGVESDSYWDIAIGEGIDRLLVSYHYIQRKGKKFLRERLEKHPNVKIMIDSGAYTFHVKEDEYKQKPMEFWDNYLEKYTSFIKANKDIIFSCVELDIANIVGFERVDYFRKKYFEPLRDEGVLVCYVWHGYDGKPYWEEMCKKYDYVGFSLQGDSLSDSEMARFFSVARRYNTLTHGFAVTRVDTMSKFPFYTGDSTTWLVGTQYGELNWFDGRRMKRLKKDQWKTVYKQKYIKIGANWDLAGQENPYELIRINLIVFRQAEEYIRKRIRGKSYWLDKKVSGGGNTVTKKLIRRKKSNEETVEKETKAVITAPLSKTKRAEEVNRRDTRPNSVDEINDIPEKPKTKFEEFQTLSEPKEKVIYDLDEQIAKLPPKEWYESDAEDYKDVYRDLHLNLDGFEKDEVLDILFNFYLFLVDDELLDGQSDEELIEQAKFMSNTPVETREEAVECLIDFMQKNLTGERSDLVGEESMNEEAPPRPLERESYLEDEEFEMVDIADTEMQNFLPAPKEDGSMPEVEDIDRELKSAGIVAVRDENGRFLKGQRAVRKPKQLYSQHFPKLACNTCYKAGECPEFKPDHACAFDKVFKKFKTRNMDDLIDAMHGMADLNLERMQRLMLFETMDGGMADPVLTGMIDQNLNIMMKMKQLNDMKAQIVATQRRTMSADGTVETTTTVANPTGGILAQIFGMGGGSSDEDEDKPKKKIIDADEI